MTSSGWFLLAVFFALVALATMPDTFVLTGF